jgi:hypothetical protein
VCRQRSRGTPCARGAARAGTSSPRGRTMPGAPQRRSAETHTAFEGRRTPRTGRRHGQTAKPLSVTWRPEAWRTLWPRALAPRRIAEPNRGRRAVAPTARRGSIAAQRSAAAMALPYQGDPRSRAHRRCHERAPREDCTRKRLGLLGGWGPPRPGREAQAAQQRSAAAAAVPVGLLTPAHCLRCDQQEIPRSCPARTRSEPRDRALWLRASCKRAPRRRRTRAPLPQGHFVFVPLYLSLLTHKDRQADLNQMAREAREEAGAAGPSWDEEKGECRSYCALWGAAGARANRDQLLARPSQA